MRAWLARTSVSRSPKRGDSSSSAAGATSIEGTASGLLLATTTSGPHPPGSSSCPIKHSPCYENSTSTTVMSNHSSRDLTAPDGEAHGLADRQQPARRVSIITVRATG